MPRIQGAPWVDLLARTEGGFDLLRLAETFAGILPGLDQEDRWRLAALALAILLSAQEGHTRLPLVGAEGLEARLVPFFDGPFPIQEWWVKAPLQPAFGRPGEASCPFILGESWLTTARLDAAERHLAARVRERLAPPRHPLSACPQDPPSSSGAEGAPADQGPRGGSIHLSEAQRRAVALAVANPLTLITGGPGTGKTSIVAAILRVASRMGLAREDIALAAPTGKAAQRMGESVHQALSRIEAPDACDLAFLKTPPVPQTLHRLLGNRTDGRRGFRHHADNPLGHRLVIVDEGSMVGLELMDALLAALGPESRLVLLGDAQQLPSVEAGAVFRDLKEALSLWPDPPVMELVESHRMDPGDPAGRSVFMTAQAMLLEPGRAMEALDAPGALQRRASWQEITGTQAEHAEANGEAVQGFLARYLETEILGQPGFQAAARRVFHPEGEAWPPGDEEALGILFRTHERVKLLTPLRQAPLLQSADGLNAALHAAYGRSLEAEAMTASSGDLAIYAGEPVMVTGNDYVRELFNGDQGVVVRARLRGGVHQAVAFRQGASYRLVPYRAIREAGVTAWALTIHKAQGSEFDRVVIVLPPDTPLLTRELLYTALTRARRGATLLGSRQALEEGLRRRTIRHTGLREALGTGAP